jgi:carbon storage regulator
MVLGTVERPSQAIDAISASVAEQFPIYPANGGALMLVLSRKPGEQLRIGDNITITVVEVRGNRVKIGIEAPRSVGVVRSELELHTAAVGHAATGMVKSESFDAVCCVD